VPNICGSSVWNMLQVDPCASFYVQIFILLLFCVYLRVNCISTQHRSVLLNFYIPLLMMMCTPSMSTPKNQECLCRCAWNSPLCNKHSMNCVCYSQQVVSSGNASFLCLGGSWFEFWDHLSLLKFVVQLLSLQADTSVIFSIRP